MAEEAESARILDRGAEAPGTPKVTPLPRLYSGELPRRAAGNSMQVLSGPGARTAIRAASCALAWFGAGCGGDGAEWLPAFEQELPGMGAPLAMLPVPGTSEGPQPFWMAGTELPRAAFEAFLEARGEGADALPASFAESEGDAARRAAAWPATGVSAEAALAYCVWLSERTGRKFRLPTSAEWRRACRGADVAPAPHAHNPAELPHYAWFAKNADGRPHPVGSLLADGLGIHDLLGNVGEWCEGPGGPEVLGGDFRAFHTALACDAQVDRSGARTQGVWWRDDRSPLAGIRLVCAPEL